MNLSGQSIGDAGSPGVHGGPARGLRAPTRATSSSRSPRRPPARDIGQATLLAERLSALGCGFALDDFGTGYGSFTYLKHLPVDYMKIDMEFVRHLKAGSPDVQVVSAIIDVARKFGIQTVAEGVESQETLDLLRELGADYAQGYHLGFPASDRANGPPTDAAELERASRGTPRPRRRRIWSIASLAGER